VTIADLIQAHWLWFKWTSFFIIILLICLVSAKGDKHDKGSS